MSLTKRATVYFDPDIHKILKIKAAETSSSISQIIDEIVKKELKEDEEDLQIFTDRAAEPTISYEALLKDLKADGKI